MAEVSARQVVVIAAIAGAVVGGVVAGGVAAGAGGGLKQAPPPFSGGDVPVPLLYGSLPAYRQFDVGMSDGADVGQLTRDLIALGFGDGLAQGNHYSSATAAAVQRWQKAVGLQETGEIPLGEAVFEPGPIRVTSVPPAGGTPAGGGNVLTATTPTPALPARPN